MGEGSFLSLYRSVCLLDVTFSILAFDFFVFGIITFMSSLFGCLVIFRVCFGC
jgi:hypothetical protein